MPSVMTSPRNGAAVTSKIPPHNVAAEESLLGSMMLSREGCGDALTMVSAEDFYKPSHGVVFDAIKALYSRNSEIDAVTVGAELAREGNLEAIGGPSALVELLNAPPSAGAAPHYAKIVEDLALLRRMIGVGGEISQLGYENQTDVRGALDMAEELMFKVAERRVSDTMRSVESLVGATLDHMEELANRGDEITGMPTGFYDIDDHLLGLQPGALVIVGARPAMGKTTFALNIASNSSVQTGRPVLLFSLEMSHVELTTRMVCSMASVDSMKMRKGKLNERDWRNVTDALDVLGRQQIYIDDNASITIMDIRTKARRLKARLGDIGLVVVDYIQLMKGSANSENRQLEVSEISRGLKLLARELDCPVMALSQLSRTLESRPNKRPMLADLRESGALEQDADVVMFLYRDELYDPESAHKGEAEVIVAKHRAGETFSRSLAFNGSHSRFQNMAREP